VAGIVRKFWHSEILKVWLQYCAAAVAMIPGGTIYVALLEHHRDERMSFLVSVGVAVAVGTVAWLGVGRIFQKPVSTELGISFTLVRVESAGTTIPAMAAAFALVTTLSYIPTRSIIYPQTDQVIMHSSVEFLGLYECPSPILTTA